MVASTSTRRARPSRARPRRASRARRPQLSSLGSRAQEAPPQAGGAETCFRLPRGGSWQQPRLPPRARKCPRPRPRQHPPVDRDDWPSVSNAGICKHWLIPAGGDPRARTPPGWSEQRGENAVALGQQGTRKGARAISNAGSCRRIGRGSDLANLGARRVSVFRARLPISSELRLGVNSAAAPTPTVRPEGACRSPHSMRPASAPALSLS
jgi:hypothetical protein